MRACRGPAVPVLRRDFEAEMEELAKAAVASFGWRRAGGTGR